MTMQPPVRVLVVDDSAVMRRLLSDGLRRDPDINVVATAPDARLARDKILALQPDVITLDIEMPGVDGLTFLKILMRDRPMPVVMVSGQGNAEDTLTALGLGAMDFIAKSSLASGDTDADGFSELAAKVKSAALAWKTAHRAVQGTPVVPRRARLGHALERVLAVGASTGGTEALRAVMEGMPPDAPGMLIVQHMPERFTAAFARRLDAVGTLRVQEARDGDRVCQGHALVAPGGRHMVLQRDGTGLRVRLTDDPPVNRHRPSVDVLFDSVADVAARHAVGVLLTGMGDDGARGLLRLREAGARTLAQDEASCVVYGMPREAVARGAAERVVSLTDMPSAMLAMAVRSQPMVTMVARAVTDGRKG